LCIKNGNRRRRQEREQKRRLEDESNTQREPFAEWLLRKTEQKKKGKEKDGTQIYRNIAREENGKHTETYEKIRGLRFRFRKMEQEENER
jgi:hypothetical protein